MTTIRARAAAAVNLTEEQARSVVACIGLAGGIALAALMRGVHGAVIILLLTAVYLLGSRVWLIDRVDTHRQWTIRAVARVRQRHDQEIRELRAQVQVLAERAGLEFTEWEPEPAPVVPPEQPSTEPIPAQPATVPMERAWDESAAELDERIADVDLAWALAAIEDQLWTWRTETVA